ncbi:hypothetical protein WN944_027334 [Citrus x changshan-huyou]|uniref:Uncharacterized protein n=1 Tax=Citrus x changshan-huyou TaxID=2935761 RepID=A0AAP0LHD9_9ROSI
MKKQTGTALAKPRGIFFDLDTGFSSGFSAETLEFDVDFYGHGSFYILCHLVLIFKSYLYSVEMGGY